MSQRFAIIIFLPVNGDYKEFYEKLKTIFITNSLRLSQGETNNG